MWAIAGLFRDIRSTDCAGTSSDRWPSYLPAVNCLLSRAGLTGTGRWGVLLSYWPEAGSRRLCRRGTEVGGGFSSFDWPSPEQRGSNLHIEACSIAPASGVMWELGHSLSIRARRRSAGATYSALCFSSARIWSLGFRLYLQKKKHNKYNAGCFYCQVEGGPGDHPGSYRFAGLN